MYKLSIILPTLRYSLAVHCITAIEFNSCSDYEIIVVSSPTIIHQLQATALPLAKCKFIIDYSMNGPIAAINAGLKHCFGEYIVTLSDDCRVAPFWDSHMITFLKAQPKDQIILGNFKVYDHTGVMPTIGYFGRPFSMFPIISRENLNILGEYYSPVFNAYYSDPDLGLRVAEIGYVRTCPTAFIYHVFNSDSLHTENKHRYWQRDEEIFIKKWGHLGKFQGCEIIKE